MSKLSPGQVLILKEFEKIALIKKTIPDYWDTKPLRNDQIDRLLARGFIVQDVDRRGDERPFYKITSKGAARIGMDMCESCGGATHPEEAACLHCGTTKSWAQTPAPETNLVVSEPVDLPDYFENWWATSRFHEAPAERYSDRKQLAWDAYYAASQASSLSPLVEAVRDFIPMAHVAFLWARETPSFEELERYRSAYWKVVENLPDTPSPQTKLRGIQDADD